MGKRTQEQTGKRADGCMNRQAQAGWRLAAAESRIPPSTFRWLPFAGRGYQLLAWATGRYRPNAASCVPPLNVGGWRLAADRHLLAPIPYLLTDASSPLLLGGGFWPLAAFHLSRSTDC